MTNFERVTKSPEALANFAIFKANMCECGCDRCVVHEVCEHTNWLTIEKMLVIWLKQESEECGK